MIFKLNDQVSHKPRGQRVIGLGCEKPELTQPMMKVFLHLVHLTDLLRVLSQVADICFWNFD